MVLLEQCAHELKVNFIGGYSAIVSKGMTNAEKMLIESIPEAMKVTQNVCSSVNVGSTKTGINMDAVKMLGKIIKDTAEITKEDDSIGCAKLVVLCNAPDDNPFMLLINAMEKILVSCVKLLKKLHLKSLVLVN